jgi:hypothetical protein
VSPEKQGQPPLASGAAGAPSLTSQRIAQPALVWGATIGFVWGTVRYLTAGFWPVGEILFIGALAVVLWAGVLYLKEGWQHRHQ